VRAHEVPEKGAHKAVPYGIDDLAADAGWVSVGCDGTPPGFAVATLRRWWDGEGRHRYPAATRLPGTADAGGANGYRVRAWKQELAGFAHASGLQVTVCQVPPGTSKWNKIEHRLCWRISSNWRGRPLTSHEVVVGTIGATTTRTGLTVHAELDPGAYPTGVTIPDEVMVALPLTAHDWHGTWKDTLRPEPPAPLLVPRYQDRTGARGPGPGLAAPPHPHRHGHPRGRRPAGRSRAGSPRPPADQPAPQTRPAPHPAARSPVAVRPAAGHRPPATAGRPRSGP
jgi:hypothetical protein